MSDDRGSGLLTGLVIGAVLGAGVTFLFGTKNGKEIRDRIRDEYLEVFDRLDEVFENVQENLQEKYDDVVDEVQKVKKEVAELEEGSHSVVIKKMDTLGKAVESLGTQIQKVSADKSSHRFLKSGRKL